MGMVKPRRTVSRQATRSALLEQCVQSLHMLNFQIYASQGEYDGAAVRSDRYVICNYPHLSLYGTPGRKEAYIVAGDACYILEAKWQDSSGSVDEKLPYVWHSFLDSPVQNWLAVLDGRYWTKDARALQGKRWLKMQQPPEHREFLVLTRNEFIKWATSKWGFETSDGSQQRRERYYERRNAGDDAARTQESFWGGGMVHPG